jgi:hypothetical protein
MTQQNNPQMVGRNDKVTVITDVNGEVILEIGLHEYTIKDNDGHLIQRHVNENITLVCGTTWNPGLIDMAKIYVGVCQPCRTAIWGPKTHGLVALHRAKLCTDCGTLVCPTHARLGRDKKWRCTSHHRNHLLKSLLHPIFFERKEG